MMRNTSESRHPFYTVTEMIIATIAAAPAASRVHIRRGCRANRIAHTIYSEMGVERRAIMGVGDSFIRVAVGIEAAGGFAWRL